MPSAHESAPLQRSLSRLPPYWCSPADSCLTGPPCTAECPFTGPLSNPEDFPCKGPYICPLSRLPHCRYLTVECLLQVSLLTVPPYKDPQAECSLIDAPSSPFKAECLLTGVPPPQPNEFSIHRPSHLSVQQSACRQVPPSRVASCRWLLTESTLAVVPPPECLPSRMPPHRYPQA